MIRETSILAYREAVKNLAQKQRMVFDIIAGNPGITNVEIASRLHWPINCVVPRTLELREKGLVGQFGYKIINNRRAISWHILRDFDKQEKQQELFKDLGVMS